MTEHGNHRVYEVTIREQVILHTTFRVAVDAEDELDEEAALEAHINNSPAYLYQEGENGDMLPNYFCEVEDIEDGKPELTDIVELPDEAEKGKSNRICKQTVNVSDDQGLSLVLVDGEDLDLDIDDPRGDRDRIESYLIDNDIEFDDVSLEIEYEEQYL